jgi:hypothetical protein
MLHIWSTPRTIHDDDRDHSHRRRPAGAGLAAAERAGKTAHAFILDAIAQTVEQAEHGEAFHRVADERWANVLATGQTVPDASEPLP